MLSMAWNYTAESSLDQISNLDILSPNWFVMDKDLNISDQGSPDYVIEAQARGLKVHPRLEGPMSPNWGAATIFNNSGKRRTIIGRLLYIIDKYKKNAACLDGINLDFEAIGPEAKDGYTCLVGELAPILKAQGLTISIDVPGLTSYVNKNGVWSGGFDFSALGQIPELNYIIIMAYDWTYGAPKSYVRDALNYAVELIPRAKILLGVPLYSQDYICSSKGFNSLWGTISPSGKYYYRKAQSTINAPGANPQLEWLDDFGVTKVTYLNNGVSHLMFLEDPASLKVKLDLAKESGVAGIAAWRLKDVGPKIYQVFGEKTGKLHLD